MCGRPWFDRGGVSTSIALDDGRPGSSPCAAPGRHAHPHRLPGSMTGGQRRAPPARGEAGFNQCSDRGQAAGLAPRSPPPRFRAGRRLQRSRRLKRSRTEARPRSKRKVPGHQDRQQIVASGYVRHRQPRGAGQLVLCQRLDGRQPRQGWRATGRGLRGSRRRQRGRDVRPQRRNPGLGRGRRCIMRGIRTVQPFPHPCSAAPPACAAGAPTRCASRAGGCQYAAARPPARCRARRHCGAAAPAAPRLRG